VSEQTRQHRMAVATRSAAVVARIAATMPVKQLVRIAAFGILIVTIPQVGNAWSRAITGTGAINISTVAIQRHRPRFVRGRHLGLRHGGRIDRFAEPGPPGLSTKQTPLHERHGLGTVVRVLRCFRKTPGRIAYDNSGCHQSDPSHGSSPIGPLPIHRTVGKIVWIFATSVSGTG
jgi:hypothetical protein